MGAGHTRCLERDVDTEHASRGVGDLAQRDRAVGAARRVAVLRDTEQRPVGLQREEDRGAALVAGHSEGEQAVAGDLVAAAGHRRRVGQVHVREPADDRRCVAGEFDADGFADHAAAAVGADEPARVDRVRARRQRDAVGPSLESRQAVAPAHVDAEVAGALLQQADQPRLREDHRVHRVVLEAKKTQRHAGEHPAVRRLRRTVLATEGVVEAAHVELPDDLSDKPVGLRLVAGAGQRIEDDSPHPGEGQLACQHQPVRSGSGDDDVGVLGHGRPFRVGSGRPAATWANPARMSSVMGTGGSATT